MGTLFALRTWSGFLALALAVGAYAAAGASVAYLHLSPGLGAGSLFLAASALLVFLAERWRPVGNLGVEVLRFSAVVPVVVMALIYSTHPAGRGLEQFAAGLATIAWTVAPLRRSAGYALAAGLCFVIVTLEVGFRHFAHTVGVPLVLLAAVVVLLGVCAVLARVLPRLAGSGAGHLGGDRVDLGQELRK